MDISYLVRQSHFLEPCEMAIRRDGAKLASGGVVRIGLGPRGFSGDIRVTIRRGDRSTFGSDFKGADSTWFPARIKAAATALLNCGHRGRFDISHDEGELSIRAHRAQRRR
jgi:hypothetical protein